MRLYKDKIFPVIMNKNIGKTEIIELRRNLLKTAKGDILEIGIGTGINLPLYPKEVTQIYAVDPYVRTLANSNISVTLFNESAEKMSFPNKSFDVVVSTFTLCSTKEIEPVLLEVKRILKDNGRFVFLEHGKAKNSITCKLQNLFNPIYNYLACGCNINRNYKEFIEKTGFNIIDYNIKRANIHPKFLTGYIHEGVATK